MYDRAYSTLRQLQQQAAEPKKQQAEPEPPEPPKPNGGIQIAVAPVASLPSRPEVKNDETNPSTVARRLLDAASRLPANLAGYAAKLVTATRSKMYPQEPSAIGMRGGWMRGHEIHPRS